MKYNLIISASLITTSLLASNIDQSLDSHDERLKSLKKVAKTLPNKNDGIDGFLSPEAKFLKEDVIDFLEKEISTVFNSERMQLYYTPFFYIHLMKRITLSEFAQNTFIPLKESFNIFGRASEAIPNKEIEGYRVSFTYGKENIYLNIFPAQVEPDFGIRNMEKLYIYKLRVLDHERTFSTQTASKALIDKSKTLTDSKGGKWTFSNEPSALFLDYFSKGGENLEFFKPVPGLQSINGATNTFFPCVTKIDTERDEKPQEVFQVKIGLKVRAPQNQIYVERMVLELNYQPKAKEDAFIYHCSLREKLSSSQTDHNFTDVVFFTEN